MRELKILQRKEVKELKKSIKDQYGADFEDDVVFLKSKDDDIYIAERELFEVDFSELRTDAFGLYLGEVKHDKIRFSTEGAQRIGPLATKNIIELTFEEMRAFFHGEDIEMTADRISGDEKTASYVILKHGKDFISCSRFKDNKLINFIPKVRRIKTAD